MKTWTSTRPLKAMWHPCQPSLIRCCRPIAPSMPCAIRRAAGWRHPVRVGDPETDIVIEEQSLPVRPDVAAACAILGMDRSISPTRGLCFYPCPARDAESVLRILQPWAGQACGHHRGGEGRRRQCLCPDRIWNAPENHDAAGRAASHLLIFYFTNII